MTPAPASVLAWKANAILDSLESSGRLTEAHAIRFWAFMNGLKVEPGHRLWNLATWLLRGKRLTWRQRHELKAAIVGARAPRFRHRTVLRIQRRGSLRRFWFAGKLVTARTIYDPSGVKQAASEATPSQG